MYVDRVLSTRVLLGKHLRRRTTHLGSFSQAHCHSLRGSRLTFQLMHCGSSCNRRNNDAAKQTATRKRLLLAFLMLVVLVAGPGTVYWEMYRWPVQPVSIECRELTLDLNKAFTIRIRTNQPFDRSMRRHISLELSSPALRVQRAVPVQEGDRLAFDAEVTAVAPIAIEKIHATLKGNWDAEARGEFALRVSMPPFYRTNGVAFMEMIKAEPPEDIYGSEITLWLTDGRLTVAGHANSAGILGRFPPQSGGSGFWRIRTIPADFLWVLAALPPSQRVCSGGLAGAAQAIRDTVSERVGIASRRPSDCKAREMFSPRDSLRPWYLIYCRLLLPKRPLVWSSPMLRKSRSSGHFLMPLPLLLRRKRKWSKASSQILPNPRICIWLPNAPAHQSVAVATMSADQLAAARKAALELYEANTTGIKHSRTCQRPRKQREWSQSLRPPTRPSMATPPKQSVSRSPPLLPRQVVCR